MNQNMNQSRNTRKIILFLIDTIIIIFSCIFIFIVLPQNYTLLLNISEILPHCIVMVAVLSATRFIFKTYDSLWRYADTREYLLLVIADFIGCLLSFIIDRIIFSTAIPLLYIASTYMFSLLLVLCSRFFYRQLRRIWVMTQSGRQKNKTLIAIVGAGYAGTALLDEIKVDDKSDYIPFCFFDNDISKIGKSIQGIKVKGTVEQIPDILKNSSVKEIIIAIPSISPEDKKNIIDICTKTDCKVKVYEYPFERMDLTIEKSKGNSETINVKKQLRDINIEDLLCRESITFDLAAVRSFIENKTILITGGGGSIGSELSRQIAKMNPKKLIILDIYENNAYDIQQELNYTYGDKLSLNVEIASVRELHKIDVIFNKYKPEVVFHAAAHKHVPLMESCCDEAIKNNVFGTYNVVKTAEKYGAKKMIMISTDKAVNPTNIMGASKRLCEMIIQSMKNSKTEYVAVRFGNVLGSNGSVIPLFKKQIEHGGPITITDKRIIRYFMTISEAVQLVMQAGTMAVKSEIFVLDMGQPIKILDLAENMIKLSDLKPYKDIDIKEIGLRPGEKLYEELLMKTEELNKTDNKKIFIERESEISRSELEDKLDQLKVALETDDNEVIKATMMKIVPTYKTPESVNKKFIVENTEENINKETAEPEHSVEEDINVKQEDVASAV